MKNLHNPFILIALCCIMASALIFTNESMELFKEASFALLVLGV